MQLREIMKRDVYSVFPETSVTEAARKMRDHHVGCLLVMEPNGKAKGILTDRDIVLEAVAFGADPDRVSAADVMHKGLVCARPEMDILEASGLMSTKGVGRLPIEEDGRIVGIISLSDLARVTKGEIDNLLSPRGVLAYH